MLEAALVAGIASVGRDAISLGIVPTPAVACVTRAIGAAAGVVISASHNPIADNGIKFFGSDGFKLSDELEDRIEASLESPELPRPTGTGVGVARVAHNLVRHYYRRAQRRRRFAARSPRGRRRWFRGGVCDRSVRVAQARRAGHGNQLRKRRSAHQRQLRCDGFARVAGGGSVE